MITKTELRAKNHRAGEYFFSRATMRYFNSKLETGGYYGWQSYLYEEGGSYGWYFVYSNHAPYTNGRVYIIAFMREDGSITPAERPQYDNLREAHLEAKRLAKESLENEQSKQGDDFQMEEADDSGDIQPDHDSDYFITPSGNLGGKLSVSQGGKWLGEFTEHDAADDFIRQRAHNNKWFPSVWHVSDHGNVWPYSLDYDKEATNEN